MPADIDSASPSVLHGMSRWAKAAADHWVTSYAAAAQGLRVREFEGWHAELADALQCLPEPALCPHELYRQLIEYRGPTRKRTFLVLERGDPVAVVAVNDRSNYWEPVTQWLIPGTVFPVKEGYLWRVLGALGLNLHIGLWRCEIEPQAQPWIRNLRTEPTHGMACSDDYEAHWKTSNLYKNLKNIRNRCRDFEYKTNAPGVLEWTIRNWGSTWNQPVEERLLVARYLNEHALLNVFSLHDQGEPVAGITNIVHGRDAVAYVNCRKPEYLSYGVATRLLELNFFTAREMGFSHFDIGGSQDYKERWAPESGIKHEFDVRPPSPPLMQSRPYVYAKQLWRRMRGGPARNPAQPPPAEADAHGAPHEIPPSGKHEVS